MTHLILKQDGIIHVFDMPEPKEISGIMGHITMLENQEAKESAISNAVRCEDQGKAKQILYTHHDDPLIATDHPYPIPGLAFDVKEIFPAVAVLHEEPVEKKEKSDNELQITKEDFKLIKSFYPDFTRKQVPSNDFIIGWSEIMPVVEKIAEYRIAYPKEAGWVCDCKIVVIQKYLYREVVNFIKWYNSNKEK